jgi:protein-arginine kinase activator protein McsA
MNEQWKEVLNSEQTLNNDFIKSPKHYSFFDTEVIDIIRSSMTTEQFIGYCKGNAIKYRLRAGKKDDTLQDILKAEEYELYYRNMV